MAGSRPRQIDSKGYVDVRWGQLHFRRAGSGGPTLVLFHQTPSSSRMWEAVLPGLASDFQVIALDTPGYGFSDPPPGPPSFIDYVDVFFEALDALGVDVFAPVGYQTGAAFALKLASERPHRVSQVVLMGLPMFPDALRTERRGQPFPAIVPDEDGQFFTSTWRSSPIANRWVRLREQCDRLLAGPNAWWASDSISGEDLRPLLGEIRQPALFTYGINDSVAGYQPEAASLVSRATIVPLQGDILIVDDKPDLVVATIRKFMLETLGK